MSLTRVCGIIKFISSDLYLEVAGSVENDGGFVNEGVVAHMPSVQTASVFQQFILYCGLA